MKYNVTFLLILILILPIYTQESNSEQITVPLSIKGKSGLILVDHYKGSISVSGYKGKSVVINASYRNPETKNGMKLISNSAIKLSATEKNNIVTISTNSRHKTIDLKISVPHNFNLKLSTYDNGKVVIRDISGEFELNNNNGDVKLINVSGSAIISTIDGNIIADFLKIKADMPMMFSNVDGEINLTLPKEVNVSLKMKTEYGEIFSDFNIDLKKRKTKTQKKEQSGSIKISLDDWTYGKINKGGPEYLLKSLNGNIYIKKKK